MEEAKLTLTEDFLINLPDSSQKKPTVGTVQLLSWDTNKSGIISDGKMKEKALFYKESEKLHGDISKLPVLSVFECNVLIHKETIIIISLKIIHRADKDTPIIGNPISKKEYEEANNQYAEGASHFALISRDAGQMEEEEILDKEEKNRASGPIEKLSQEDSESIEFTPIMRLNMNTKNWTLKVVCKYKGDVRTFNKKKTGQQSKVATLIFQDNSGTIKATLWGEEVDKFYPSIEEGNVYSISNCTINPADNRWDKTTSTVALTINRQSKLKQLNYEEGESGIKKILFPKEFLPLDKINKLGKRDFVNVLAVVCSDEIERINLTKKDGGNLKKTVLKLVDKEMIEVELFFWEDRLSDEELRTFKKGTPVCIIEAITSEFQGKKSINLTQKSIILDLNHKDLTNQDVREKLTNLKQWFSSAFKESQLKVIENKAIKKTKLITISELKALMDIEHENVKYSTKETYSGKWAGLIARVVTFTNKRQTYKSKSNDKHFYFGSMKIADHTGEVWCKYDNKVGVSLFGVEAEKFRELEADGGIDDKFNFREETANKLNELKDKSRGRLFYLKLRTEFNDYNGDQSVQLKATTIGGHESDHSWKLAFESITDQIERYFGDSE